MSALAQAADDYLAIRRSLGFKLSSQGDLLKSFIRYADQSGAKVLTIDLALAWAELPEGKDPVWCARRLGVVRIFARYLQTLDPRTEVPPMDLLPQRSRRATPFLYSAEQILALMAAARQLRLPLSAATYETVIGLLSCTGMRVGEVIRLDDGDIDWDQGVIRVVSSKFARSREVVLHPSTVAVLRGYIARRDELRPVRRTASVFVSNAGTRLLAPNVRRVFGRLLQVAQIKPRSRRCRPRIHDLRHLFAVTTLLAWYRDGGDVQARLPLLSTYLGHVDPCSTYWYLEATPELLALAAARRDRVPGRTTP